MTTLYASADRIRAEAARLDPVKVFVTLLLVVPFVLFWSARFVWFVLALLVAAGMEGWRVASTQIDSRRSGSD